MRGFLLLGIIIGFFPLSAGAFEMDVVKEPICFQVRNEAAYAVRGTIGTNYYPHPSGVKARHRSNFKLEPAGTVEEGTGYKLDWAEFCSYGPFYEGRKLEFVLKTLVPIFSCKTRLDQGEIIVKGHRKPEGGAETWAECFE